ncbi:MAG: 30S ribosomal protein S16 [Dehalococcoidia bacterium]|jgi:small subunit ribosomal protein S16|nr:30S ribosomal protein S16 [Dehalococcoidia bacterium]
MLRIRLRRTGKKKQPSYRVVVADQRAPRDGAFVEIIGHYNPRTDPKTLVLKEDRVKHWLSIGAQPSETVHRLLLGEGLIATEAPKRDTKPSKAAQRAEAEAAAAAEAKATAEAEAAAAAEASATAEAEAVESSDDSAEETADAGADDAADADADAEESN